jgi:hypothetical protein
MVLGYFGWKRASANLSSGRLWTVTPVIAHARSSKPQLGVAVTLGF